MFKKMWVFIKEYFIAILGGGVGLFLLFWPRKSDPHRKYFKQLRKLEKLDKDADKIKEQALEISKQIEVIAIKKDVIIASLREDKAEIDAMEIDDVVDEFKDIYKR